MIDEQKMMKYIREAGESYNNHPTDRNRAKLITYFYLAFDEGWTEAVKLAMGYIDKE